MLDKLQTCLDYHGTTIKTILGNLIEEKTVSKDIFTNIFQLPGQTRFLQETNVTLIDKTDPTAPTKREDYWIQTLQTKVPMGLNVEGGY